MIELFIIENWPTLDQHGSIQTSQLNSSVQTSQLNSMLDGAQDGAHVHQPPPHHLPGELFIYSLFIFTLLRIIELLNYSLFKSQILFNYLLTIMNNSINRCVSIMNNPIIPKFKAISIMNNSITGRTKFCYLTPGAPPGTKEKPGLPQ